MNTHKYELDLSEAARHFLNITYTVHTSGKDQLLLQLPTWRPGRYELGNFAKNIVRFEVFNGQGMPLAHNKLKSHLWAVETGESETVIIRYKYYAAELNAGSSFLSTNLLYLNPVNCFLYLSQTEDWPAHIELNTPSHWKYAGAAHLDSEGSVHTGSLHEWFDSPCMLSPELISRSIRVNDYIIYLHFNGITKPNWTKLLDDFKKFIEHQIVIFGDLPVSEYHFLFHLLPHFFHHGVEHQSSTVIAMGPAYAQFSSAYEEFLAISSHEFYHTWNIKAIRPKEWLPYDYTQENYGVLSYVAEGVTTLMGDLTLLRSGVWNDQDFWTEFQKELQKHLDNFGRFNHSLSQSAFDTWLDGYSAGVPHRKVSIYTEGMMMAFVWDVMLMKHTHNQASLNTVMKLLYERSFKKGRGYSESDFISILNQVSGSDFTPIFEEYIWKANDDKGLIIEALDYLSFSLVERPSNLFAEAKLGLKLNSQQVITAVYPNSSAWQAGLWIDDKILAVNGIEGGDMSRWMEYILSDDDQCTLSVVRNHEIIEISVGVSDIGFKHYQIQRREQEDSKNYHIWKTMIQ